MRREATGLQHGHVEDEALMGKASASLTTDDLLGHVAGRCEA